MKAYICIINPQEDCTHDLIKEGKYISVDIDYVPLKDQALYLSDSLCEKLLDKYKDEDEVPVFIADLDTEISEKGQILYIGLNINSL